MKKIFRQYIFILAIILCLMCFFSGIITVREKTQYNMDMTPYRVVTVDRADSGISISFGKDSILIKREYVENLSRKAVYTMLGDAFTQLGGIFKKNGR